MTGINQILLHLSKANQCFSVRNNEKHINLFHHKKIVNGKSQSAKHHIKQLYKKQTEKNQKKWEREKKSDSNKWNCCLPKFNSKAKSETALSDVSRHTNSAFVIYFLFSLLLILFSRVVQTFDDSLVDSMMPIIHYHDDAFGFFHVAKQNYCEIVPLPYAQQQH